MWHSARSAGNRDFLWIYGRVTPDRWGGVLPALNQAEQSHRGDHGSGTKAGYDRLLDAEPQRAQCPRGLADDYVTAALRAAEGEFF